jgi:hypothetical protein
MVFLASHGRGAVGDDLTTDSWHVVMQGQKWDRSDFFMLLPEAGAFNSPPNACRGERCGVWGRIAPIRLVGEFRMDWLMVLDGFGSARARF